MLEDKGKDWKRRIIEGLKKTEGAKGVVLDEG